MELISFREPRSRLMRLWHWGQFLVLTGLLLTVLLRKTVLSYRANAVILLDELQRLGVSISEDQAKGIAKIFRDNLWQWHVALGLVLTALLVVRLLEEMVTSSEQRFFRRVSVALGFLKPPRRDGRHAVHYLIVKTGYGLFYLLLAAMVVSGLSLTYHDSLQLAQARVADLKEIHELLMYFFPAFVALHLLGVIMAELGKDRGLVSDMLHGGRDE